MRYFLSAVFTMALCCFCSAGDLIVVFDKGHATVTSAVDGTDDEVRIFMPVQGWLRIEALNGTIYGRSFVDTPATNVVDLSIRLGDGNDLVQIDNNPSFRNVVIDLGANRPSVNDKDTVDISSCNYDGWLIVDTGPDQDIVELMGIENWNFVDFNYVVVDTGNGRDQVTIANSNHLADFTIIDTRDAANPDTSRNEVFVRSVITEFLWTVHGGGTDEVGLFDVDMDEAIISTGSSTDYVDITNSEINDLTVKMGSGNDELSLSNCLTVTGLVDGESGRHDRLYTNGRNGPTSRRNWEYINDRPVLTAPIFPSGPIALFR